MKVEFTLHWRMILMIRYDLEMAYAKGLRKNSETLQKLAGRAKGYSDVKWRNSSEDERNWLVA